MAAAVRNYIAPDFLVTGEPRETGLKTVLNQEGAFEYYHFAQRSLAPLTPGEAWEHCSDMSLFNYCPSEEAPFVDQRILTSSWQDYQASGTPTKILHVAANLYDGTRNMWVTMAPTPEFSNPAYYRVLRLDPTTNDHAAVTPGRGSRSTPVRRRLSSRATSRRAASP
ncbi:MAG: hypothetical protein M5R36_08085 [Deltaproteobacteria bacterium]|nr:hypothetical protein [Deltaproteobacteria bacterium]